MSIKSKKEILGISPISHKYQITVPKEVRDSKNWKEGDRIVFVKEDERIYLSSSTEV
ncbi:AbrB/MazE/SpoVT family DNA-binding domain-containing protein [Nitrosopumilus ureiphilus]|uniref:AbrB family transcriptional regulator n=1 Tax=Nitrosopumilus ureiphilus TaxID=1470067 RepID=A0A7D5M4P3_9ARCH|nr:AbrB/MazE/SpoVT family DNA-binding domain-containing protein [Nitrosopumilus ureiphilus]QLH05991.1 AbrB family transcriptional regulator [Nitrosopumilus ureiphilus]